MSGLPGDADIEDYNDIDLNWEALDIDPRRRGLTEIECGHIAENLLRLGEQRVLVLPRPQEPWWVVVMRPKLREVNPDFAIASGRVMFYPEHAEVEYTFTQPNWTRGNN